MTEWIITNDFVGGDAWTQGPSGGGMTRDGILGHPDAVEFMLLDGDGRVRYSGYLAGEDYFAPLDDFGMPNAGCESVMYREKGKLIWEHL